MKYMRPLLAVVDSYSPDGLRSTSALAMLLLIFFSGSVAMAEALKAGVTKVDITPTAGVPLWGFSDRKSSSTGTRDPLYARVLVLEAGDKRLALVSVDLGRPFGPGSLDQLRKATQKDISVLIVA